MKKYILFIYISFLTIIYLSAQERIIIHSDNRIIYESAVTDIDSIKFQTNQSFFHFGSEKINILMSDVDSITFSNNTTTIGDIVYISYNENQVSVINPFVDKGVNVQTDNAKVTITSTSDIEDIEYYVSGTSSDGSLTISSTNSIILSLNNAIITSTTTAAINITGDATVYLPKDKTCTLSDGASNAQGATLLVSGNLIFKGTGDLNVKGNNKHAISSGKGTTIENGNIYIPKAASDGFNSVGFIMNNGSITIENAAGDGIDAGKGVVDINSGNIKIISTADDVKGIKGNGAISVNGGIIEMTITGKQSKGLSSKGDITINDGNISITASGATGLEVLGSGYDASYCAAVKSDGNLTVNGGTINIVAPSSNDGARGFSADGNITINSGNITIKTAGNGSTYINETGVKDSYSVSCIKSDVNTSLLGGVINCISTGLGGKGVSADGELIIGTAGANNNNLVLNITTTGERFYVSGSGDNADYANPKAAKSEGNLTVNSGTITINCTQSNEGGEGLESKSTLAINGGLIDIKTYDDCINATTHIDISGGSLNCVSRGNDAIDSNGTLSISGGFIVAGGTKSPEAGIDCDQNKFAITGGVIIGTGGSTSTPTSSACTQRSIIYTGTAGNAICVKNSSGNIILLYQMPTYTSSSGGGSSSSMTLLFSDPNFTIGSYTIQYGGTISGGTTINGYNTGGTYSGGSSKSFSISSMVTTIK